MTTPQVVVILGLIVTILQAIGTALTAYNANLNRQIKQQIIRATKEAQAK